MLRFASGVRSVHMTRDLLICRDVRNKGSPTVFDQPSYTRRTLLENSMDLLHVQIVTGALHTSVFDRRLPPHNPAPFTLNQPSEGVLQVSFSWDAFRTIQQIYRYLLQG